MNAALNSSPTGSEDEDEETTYQNNREFPIRGKRSLSNTPHTTSKVVEKEKSPRTPIPKAEQAQMLERIKESVIVTQNKEKGDDKPVGSDVEEVPESVHEFDKEVLNVARNQIYDNQVKKFEDRNPQVRFNHSVLGNLGLRSNCPSISMKTSKSPIPVNAHSGGKYGAAFRNKSVIP